VNADLERLSARLSYQFKDSRLFEQALTHRSAGSSNNERLEFLGDAVLGIVIANWLFSQFPRANEGQLTRMRATLVKGASLATVAKKLGLGDCLILGGGELKSGGHRRASILADCLEAIIGAIFIEGGLETCRQCIERWFADLLHNTAPQDENKDAKTRLQEYLQGRGESLPVYKLIDTQGDPHNQIFTVSCVVDGLAVPVTGKDVSRRKAEQLAAERALKNLQTGG